MKKSIKKIVNPFIQVSSALLHDENLSALAKLLYLYLLDEKELQEHEISSALGVSEMELHGLYKELSAARWFEQHSMHEYVLNSALPTQTDKVKGSALEVVETSAPTPERVIPKAPSKNMKEVSDGDRVINYLLRKRREIQPDFARNVQISKWQYEMRVDLLNSHRSAAQYLKCIDYLYSGSKEAQFWRDTVKDAQSLIRHYDSIELKFMGDKKVAANASGAKALVNVLRRQGLNDEQIQAELAKQGLI